MSQGARMTYSFRGWMSIIKCSLSFTGTLGYQITLDGDEWCRVVVTYNLWCKKMPTSRNVTTALWDAHLRFVEMIMLQNTDQYERNDSHNLIYYNGNLLKPKLNDEQAYGKITLHLPTQPVVNF